ncbi:GrpE protein 1, mitochondrial [Geranomyces variabilis]|uniref:GrpE protein homolog n=1 Tax=Geranomyces variabilis TaxID=109894 RepID=A0AAD5XPH6_9FUNG|nr:GrpE protein 1, mitochondrial [Geranomyces variabilis]
MKLATVTAAALLATAATASAGSCRQAQTADWNFLAGNKRNIILTNAAKALEVKPYSWTRVLSTPGAGEFKGTICASGWGLEAVRVGAPEKCESSAAHFTVTGNAEGTASVALAQGNDVSTTTTVSESATHSAGLDVALSATVGGELFISELGGSVTTRIAGSFTTGKATTIVESDPQTTTITRTITSLVPGKTCTISVQQATCRFWAQTYVPLTLNGWLGIEFPKAFKVRPDRPALKTWYVKLDQLAKGPNRSQMLPLKITGSAISKGNTDANCVEAGGKKHATAVTKAARSAARTEMVEMEERDSSSDLEIRDDESIVDGDFLPVIKAYSRLYSTENAKPTPDSTKPAPATEKDAQVPPEKPAAEGSATDFAAQLAEKDQQIHALQDSYRRALADAENVRQRTRKEVAETKDFAITKFAKDLLSVADVLELALAAVPESERNSPSNNHLKELYVGVDMTRSNLLATFKRFNIEAYDPIDEAFDPKFHEALFQAPVEGKTPGTVFNVAKKGYKLGDRCLRPAQVGVVQDSA